MSTKSHGHTVYRVYAGPFFYLGDVEAQNRQEALEKAREKARQRGWREENVEVRSTRPKQVFER